MNKAELKNKIVDSLKGEKEIERIIIFGSFNKSKSPNDIDIAELHDAFTPVEVISYEDVGFCKKGEAKHLIRKGKVNINGELPVNTSGGLKAKGHPISATGISQVYELAKQMRRQAGERQVGKNIEYALAQNIGGVGSTVTVHILRKVNS